MNCEFRWRIHPGRKELTPFTEAVRTHYSPLNNQGNIRRTESGFEGGRFIPDVVDVVLERQS